MVDLNLIATNLELRSDGIWYSRRTSQIDYPEEGNAFCYQLEEESFWFNHRNAFILEALSRFPPSGLLFDVGGGNGFVAKAISDIGINTILVEPGVEGVRNAQRRGINQLVCATLEDAGFQDQTLPAIGMFDVLEHIPDDLGFLHQINRLLIQGGRLYLTVPAYKFLWSNEDDFAQHYRRYTLGQLDERLQLAGFKVEFSTYIFATLPLPIFFFRTIPSKLGWRKTGDLTRVGSELKPISNTANNLLDAILKIELAILKRRNLLPFGGSCLVVARTQHRNIDY
jgi:SAM-dependent methyltransferase